MLKFCTFDIYALIDQRANLYFLTHFLATRLNIFSEWLVESISVSSHVGESILTKRVYHDRIISFNQKDVMAYLVELEILDFDFILGIH